MVAEVECSFQIKMQQIEGEKFSLKQQVDELSAQIDA